MGHDLFVHRKFYRLPHDVVQTAKVVKILMSMETGQIINLKGKSLDSIDVIINDAIPLSNDLCEEESIDADTSDIEPSETCENPSNYIPPVSTMNGAMTDTLHSTRKRKITS